MEPNNSVKREQAKSIITDIYLIKLFADSDEKLEEIRLAIIDWIFTRYRFDWEDVLKRWECVRKCTDSCYMFGDVLLRRSKELYTAITEYLRLLEL